jgi:GTP cyclohydrolase I
MRVNKEGVKRAIRQLIVALGYNPESQGLRDTPKRVAKFYADWFKQSKFEWREFDAFNYRNMVIVRRIPFFSLCEHHLLPFFGWIHIGYIPSGRRAKIVGISKLVRIVRLVSVGLNTQEVITQRIVDELQKRGIRDCIVVVEAIHTCMALRGVQVGFNTSVSTSAISGVFTEIAPRAEFLSVIGLPNPLGNR